uniref:Tetraspanin 34b n=1 Tax=Erpetoichthys calabaricus TaxID=27687 RepID=A0A8C4TQK2_ERPCA
MQCQPSVYRFTRPALFSSLLQVAGIVILAIGVWVKVDSSSFLKILTIIKVGGLSQIINVGYLCIALGLFLMIVGFLGCWGALKENKALLMLFFVIVLLIFIVEVTGGVVVLAFSSLVRQLIGIGVEAKKSIKTDYGKNTDITKVWDSLMTELKCCGFTNYNDFTGSPFHISTSNYPPVCCTNSTRVALSDCMLQLGCITIGKISGMSEISVVCLVVLEPSQRILQSNFLKFIIQQLLQESIVHV